MMGACRSSQSDPHPQLRPPPLLAKPGPALRGWSGWELPQDMAKGGRQLGGGWGVETPPPRPE